MITPRARTQTVLRIELPLRSTEGRLDEECTLVAYPGTRALQLGASLRILRLCILFIFLSAECSTIALGNAAQRALWPSPSRHGVQHAPCSRCTPGNEQRSLEEHPEVDEAVLQLTFLANLGSDVQALRCHTLSTFQK
jgi:hypothetical protein